MRTAGKLRIAALGMILVLLAGMMWLLGTGSGTRFVLARAESYLPPELELGAASGSFFGTVCLEATRWSGESTEIEIRDSCVEIELARLLSRHLVIRSLRIGEVSIVSRPVPDAPATGELPVFESPLRISVDSSTISNLRFEREQVIRVVDDIQFGGTLSGSRLNITTLKLRSDWLNAELGGRVKLAAPYTSNIDLDWRWTEPASQPFAGRLSLRGDLRNFELKHTLDAPAQLLTTGSFSYLENELGLDLENAWSDFQWEVGETQLQSPDGFLHVRGNPGRLDVALDALWRIDDLPATRIRVNGNTDLESLDFSSLVATNEYGRLSASGTADWTPATTINIDFGLSDLDPSLASDLLQGRVDASGKAYGTFGDDTYKLTVLVSSLGGKINAQTLAANGAFTATPHELVIESSRLQLGANRASVRGTVGERLSLEAELDLPAMDELGTSAAGSLSANISLRGTAEKPEVHVEASGANLAWAERTIGDLSIAVAGSPTQHTVQAELHRNSSHIVAAANGAYVDDQWIGTLDAFSLEDKLAGRWSLQDRAELTVSSDQLSLASACLIGANAAGRACASATVEPGGISTFDLQLQGLPLAALPLTLPPEVSIAGLGDLQAHGSIADGLLTGAASLNLRGARMDAIVDDEDLSAVFAAANLQAGVMDNRLESSLRLELVDGSGDAMIDLTVADIFDARSGIDGHADVALRDMSLFAVMIPDISNPRGLISGTLDISGSFAQPEVMGAVSVTDSAFGVRRAGIEISELNARVSQTDAGHLQLEGSARSGTGQIRIQGNTWTGTATGIRSELLITGQDFELSRLPDWQIAASPAIAMVFDEAKTTVTGNLLIPSTDIRIKELPETAVSPSPDAIVHRAEDSEPQVRRQIHVDIAIGLGEEVQLSGFGLTTGIEGAVRLRGGTNAPTTGVGRLTLREGTYKAYGQDLEIEHGQLIFNGPLDNPQLDIRAVRRMTDVVAGIQLAGTPSQLRSTVFSEPPLRDAEALSYLLTGRPLASATDSGDGDMLNAAAFALGVSGAANIVSQVRSGLGLETLVVEGGSEDGRLIAGKRFGDRLIVEYGYGLIDKLGTLLLRYQLTDRIVLESRTGTVSNFDIVYKVRKK